jgi:hypothetical protein
MRSVTAAVIGLGCAVAACGGNTTPIGTTCGPGTTLLDGQCYSTTLLGGGGGGGTVDADTASLGGSHEAGVGDDGADSGDEMSDAQSDGANALCEMPGGNEITFKDKTDALAHLVGRWTLCTGPGLAFATEQPNQAGVEFAADMTWYALQRQGSTLSRAGGFQASGTFRFNAPGDLDFGPSTTMDLFFGVDSSFAKLTMLDSPRKMRSQFGSPLNATPSIYARESP